MSIYSQNNNNSGPQIILNPTVSSFSVQDFQKLKDPKKSYNTPLAVIAHIDVNAFFAQVEQIKHGFTREDPVICVQWQSIIAVSYAARVYEISRMDNLKSAIKKCPHIIPLHTAVFRKGENFWRNVNSCNPNDFPSPATHKVSLDPYRRESRKMQRIFRANCKTVEKASVDESFFDLGYEVYRKAIELFPQLRDIVNNNENSQDNLPPIPNELPEELCKIRGVFMPTLEELETLGDQSQNNSQEVQLEKENPHLQLIFNDWDDIFILIGSLITLDIRKKVDGALGYTTSCGVARVKTLAKLASGFKKPDNQTIIRAKSIPNFLKNFSIVDFWGMGGKTGDQIKFNLNTPFEKNLVIEYIRDNFSMDDLIKKLDNDEELATVVYKIVRGELYAPFSEKSEPSMCSSKRFRGESVTSQADCVGWLKVFAGDLFQRIKEINEEEFGFNYDNDIEEEKSEAKKNLVKKTRCPRSLSLHYNSLTTSTHRSRQMPIPLVPIDKLEITIFEAGVKLLEEILNQAKYEGQQIFPLGLMSLTASKFEIASGVGFIENFFKSNPSGTVKPSLSSSLKSESKNGEAIIDENGQKIEENKSLFIYESRKQFVKNSPKNNIHSMLKGRVTKYENSGQTENDAIIDKNGSFNEYEQKEKLIFTEAILTNDDQEVVSEFFCESCNTIIKNETKNRNFINEHQDYHFAISFSTKLNGEKMTNTILKKDSKQPVVYDLTSSPPPLLLSSSSQPAKLKRTNSETNNTKQSSNSKNNNKNKKSKLGKGQSTLPFF